MFSAGQSVANCDQCRKHCRSLGTTGQWEPEAKGCCMPLGAQREGRDGTSCLFFSLPQPPPLTLSVWADVNPSGPVCISGWFCPQFWLGSYPQDQPACPRPPPMTHPLVKTNPRPEPSLAILGTTVLKSVFLYCSPRPTQSGHIAHTPALSQLGSGSLSPPLSSRPTPNTQEFTAGTQSMAFTS